MCILSHQEQRGVIERVFLYVLYYYKIELNNKINKELEEMAKCLYNYWFVQFEFPNEDGKPYKSSGGEMEYNEELRREIPRSWEVKSLRDLVDTNKTPCSQEEYKSSYVMDLSIMPSNSITINEISEPNSFKSNLYKMKEFDLLFGSIRPYLNKGGIAPFNGGVNGTIHSYSPKNHKDYSLLVCCLFNPHMFKFAVSRSKGTKMPVVDNDSLLCFKLTYNENISYMFNNLIFDNWEKLIFNIKQNQELIRLRDFLLPLLMNGQVKVK